MKKTAGICSRLIAAALILALLCVPGCRDDSPAAADEEYAFTNEENTFSDGGNAFIHYMEFEDYGADEILNTALEEAGVLGESWYGDGETGEHDWLLDYAVTAHTPDGRGVFVLEIPGSAGMSQQDFLLLTTEDYGRTWTPRGGVYHIEGCVAQVVENNDCVYIITESGAMGTSRVIVSEDFCGTFRMYTSGDITPGEYKVDMSELFGVYMRIINVESDGGIVLEYHCNGYIEDMDSGEYVEYDSDFLSNDERTVMILRSDAGFSQVKTLYADERFFSGGE